MVGDRAFLAIHPSLPKNVHVNVFIAEELVSIPEISSSDRISAKWQNFAEGFERHRKL
jgi:hypothetical protein